MAEILVQNEGFGISQMKGRTCGKKSPTICGFRKMLLSVCVEYSAKPTDH
jgi:hypothetical protein